MTRPEIGGISPFFIVRDLTSALAFYRDQLAFALTFAVRADDPFSGIVERERAMIMLRYVRVDPLPSYKREPGARSDAYPYVSAPDGLAAELASRKVEFSEPLKDTH